MLKKHLNDFLSKLVLPSGIQANQDLLNMLVSYSSIHEEKTVNIDLERLSNMGVSKDLIAVLPESFNVKSRELELAEKATVEVQKIQNEFNETTNSILEKLAEAQNEKDLASILDSIGDRAVADQINRALIGRNIVQMADIYTDGLTGILNQKFYETFFATNDAFRRAEDVDAYNIFLTGLEGKDMAAFFATEHQFFKSI